MDILAKSNSVEQHIYYNDGQEPEKISHFAPMSMQVQAEKEGMESFLNDKRVDAQGKKVPLSNRSSQTTQPNILRTVYLPNEQVGQIKTDNDKLNSQIAQERVEHERVLMQLRDQKGQFEEDQRVQYLVKKQRVE